jgi:glycosyltransferase involved in cell wall biosynthesis
MLLPHHPQLRRPPGERVRCFSYRYAPAAWSLWGYAQSLESDVRVRRAVYLLAPLVALSLRRSLRARLRAEPYDLVHAHWVVPNAALVTDVVRTRRLPFVISLHGSDVFLAERFAPARWLAGAALRAAGFVSACSSDLRERALALGADAARTRSVPYGVDTRAFAPVRADAEVRAALGVEGDALLVLALGRLVEKKGFRFLIEAVAGLPGVQVVIAGDGDLRASLTAQARACAAPVLFPGNLERARLATALATADVVAVPSVVDSAGNVDGLPNTLLEALASGRALVASRVAGIPDVVQDGVTGLLVPPCDAVALRAALVRLRDDVGLRTALGAAARAQAVRELTWDASAAQIEAGYDQALAWRHDRPRRGAR